MAALSSSQFLYAGVFFAILLAGFLAACAIVHFLGEPSDDETHDAIALGGGSLADELRRHAAGPSPDHIESSFHHGKGNTL